jgi:hypothetical protein
MSNILQTIAKFFLDIFIPTYLTDKISVFLVVFIDIGFRCVFFVFYRDPQVMINQNLFCKGLIEVIFLGYCFLALQASDFIYQLLRSLVSYGLYFYVIYAFGKAFDKLPNYNFYLLYLLVGLVLFPFGRVLSKLYDFSILSPQQPSQSSS